MAIIFSGMSAFATSTVPCAVAASGMYGRYGEQRALTIVKAKGYGTGIIAGEARAAVGFCKVNTFDHSVWTVEGQPTIHSLSTFKISTFEFVLWVGCFAAAAYLHSMRHATGTPDSAEKRGANQAHDSDDERAPLVAAPPPTPPPTIPLVMPGLYPAFVSPVGMECVYHKPIQQSVHELHQILH